MQVMNLLLEFGYRKIMLATGILWFILADSYVQKNAIITPMTGRRWYSSACIADLAFVSIQPV